MVLALTALMGVTPSVTLPYSRFTEGRMDSAEACPAIPASSPAGSLLAELNDLILDCCHDDWDGYGAKAVGIHAFAAAKRFADSLPAGFPLPSVSADPEGCVTFEWRKSPRRVLLASVHPNFQVDYAAIFGSAKQYGSEPFFNEMPESLKTIVRRIFAA